MRTFFKALPLGIALILTLPSLRLPAQNNPTEPPFSDPVLLDGHQQRQVLRVQSSRQTVRFQNLIPGESYLLKVPKDPVSDLCLPAMRVLHAPDSIPAAADELVFKADSASIDLLFEYPCSWDESNPPTHYVSLVCKTCLKKTVGEYMRASAGEIMVTPGVAPNTLIRDVLIGGDCFDVTNVQYHGQPGQIGTFSNGQTNIGFSEGVVMATGNAAVTLGPNTTDNADQGYGNSTPDADLTELSNGGDIYDMAYLEFDFRPTQSSVAFDFVFASEEYCEYVGSPFNDAFGFFISGPGISGPFNGAENIALVPSTTTYVAINNVNHLLNSGYFINNTPPSGLLCGQTGVNTPAVNQIQYDGFTKKITVRATLQTCKTYHIKLKIADVADGIFDSAVFLKAGSFNAGSNASVQWVVDGVPNSQEAYENCNDVSLVFRRVGGNLGAPLTVNYSVSGTATSGADFSGIPASVVIPAGQQQVVIPVNILADALPENPETIHVMLANLCNCSRPEEVLTILDVLPLQVTADSLSICNPGTATVSAGVQGGAGPFSYEWSNGMDTPSISPFVAGTQTFTVTVTDHCLNTSVATALVEVEAPVSAQLQTPAPQLCFGQADSITVILQGTPPFTIQYTLDGAPQPPVQNIQSSPFKLLVTQPGTYQLTAVTGGDCTGVASGTLVVTEAFIDISTTVTNLRCNGVNDGMIVPQVNGGQAPYSYTWNGPQTIPPDTPVGTGLQAGTYQLTVSDAFGCRALETYTIVEPPLLSASIAGTEGTDCDNPTAGSIDLEMNGGTPGYNYNWSNLSSLQDPQNLSAGTYTVTVTDQMGCTTTAVATVAGDFATPAAMAQVTGPLSCTVLSVPLNGAGSSTGPGFTYLWVASNGGNIFSGANTLSPVVNAPGTYTLHVRNTQNGCVSMVTVQQIESVDYPVADAGDDIILNCTPPNALLDGSGSSQGSNFMYHWTATDGGVLLNGANTMQPLAGHGGTYILQVLNNLNGCASTDSVVIVENNFAPVASVALPDSFTCLVNTVTLIGTSNPPTDVSYQWLTMDGQFQSGQTNPIATVTEPGTYTLIATFQQSGCADTVSVVVEQNFVEPLAVVFAESELNCSNGLVTINGTNSILAPGTTFVWSASSGGQFDSGTNTMTPVVNGPGTYTLLLTNPQNSCSSSATILVEDHSDPPPANAGDPDIMTCFVSTLVLGDASADPVYIYGWTAANGGHIALGENTPTPLVDAPGTYILSVLNPVNGCIATDTVLVLEDEQQPIAVAVSTGTLDCIHLSVQLNGAGSSTGPGFTYAWSSSTGNGIIAGAQTLTPTVTAPAVYTITVTNGTTGCQSTASAAVLSNNNAPEATAVPVGSLSCTNQTIQINGTGSETGPGITYMWESAAGPILVGQGTLQATVGQPGLYTLIVSNANNSCTASHTVEVELDTVPPVADAGPGQMLICTVPSLMLDGSGSSSGTGIQYQWTASPGGNFISVTNIPQPTIDQPGTYQIVVTDVTNGCTASDQVQIGVDPEKPLLLIAPPDTLDCLVNQVTIDASASSTGNIFTYQWSGPGILSGANSPQIQANLAGNYSLLIVNTVNGCSSVGNVLLQQDTLRPPANAGADIALNCTTPEFHVGDANAPVFPYLNYTWTGPGIVSGANGPAPIVDSAGVYNVLVVNTINGCSAGDAVQVNADFALPQVDAGDPFVLDCSNPSYTLNATASQGSPFTYLWSTDTGHFLTVQDTLQPAVNAKGMYTLTVTNSENGCTVVDSVFIDQSNNTPTAVIAPPLTLTCTRAQITIDASASSSGSGYQYDWTVPVGGYISSGANTLTPVVNAPGTYFLQVTDLSNNCVAVTSVTVIQNIVQPQLEVDTGIVINCSTPILNLDVHLLTPGKHAYQWIASDGGFIISGAFTAHPFISSAGTYQVYVINLLNGCVNTDTMYVTADQTPPTAQIALPEILTCNKQEIQLVVSSTASPVSYEWSSSDGHFLTVGDTTHVSVDLSGIYEVTVTNNVNGCTTVAATQVLEDRQLPVAQAGFNGELSCNTTFLNLNGAGSSSGSQYSYEWTTQDGEISAGEHTLTPTILKGGTYLLTVVNENNGCSSTDAALVTSDTMQPVIVIPEPENLTCLQTQVTIHASATSGNGSNNFEYTWSTQNGSILSGANTANLVVDATGDYLLMVTDLGNGCSNALATSVSAQVTLPDADAGVAPKLTCTVDEVTLQGAGPTGPDYTISWTTQNGNISDGDETLQPVVNEPGMYMLTILDENTGCRSTDTVEVLEETNIPTDFTAQMFPPSCRENDGLIVFQQVSGGIGPYLYSINQGMTYDPVPEFENLAPGTYQLRIRDANGCEFSKTIVVPLIPDINIQVIPEVDIKLGESYDLHSIVAGYPLSLIDTVIWTPMEGLIFDGTGILDLLNPTLKPNRSTEYIVTIISVDGCMASDSVLVRVDDEPHIYIPNAFSPWNDDNQNDIVLVFASPTQVLNVRKFYIFDRWGDMVFERENFPPNDPQFGWNGRIKGKLMDPAVFVYYAVVDIIDGRIVVKMGDITLVK
ncbi:MAG TPA: choice-of-anchor L domain-containing protein [Saprospiraceae bacterium]|nr:choice-of-anchor L domain-containing protein [Saprospiraceae bacterium]HPI06823.1 choice-of-anchor L domain-containing protein [Saprospiraceae bacterium]